MITIEQPTAILNPQQAQRNIERMAAKAAQSAVRFRPHFKTHQSATVGAWFQAAGVTAITVSSVRMAEYFAAHGWQDITIAFPVNWLEIQRINKLAAQIRLGLLVESVESAAFLADKLTAPAQVWLKIDTGYHRTGIPWDDATTIQQVLAALAAGPQLQVQGLLSHSGHSYQAESLAAIRHIYTETVERLHHARRPYPTLALSLGDTPCCSVVEDFSAVDEIRPGNFVFYDWTMASLGVCQPQEIALAVACPVVARHSDRLILYGGAVHFSKDFLRLPDAGACYGVAVAKVPAQGAAIAGWAEPIPEAYLSSLSQEHGTLRADPDFLAQTQPGDVVMVLPVHACLTANLLKGYRLLDGASATMMQA